MLEIEGVSIRFGDNPEAVSDTTFTVGDGDRLAVVGETGSGKRRPAVGRTGAAARLSPGHRFYPPQRPRAAGLPGQEFNQIRGKRSPIFRREAGMDSIHSIPWATSFARPFESISPVPGEKRWFRRPRCWSPWAGAWRGSVPQLSFSALRRYAPAVLIAMGIAAGADLVLADEPTKGWTAGASPWWRMPSNGWERTLLCVTHDLRFAHAISSRVVVMYASQQIESGDSPPFFAEPLHPYSRAMLEALPEKRLHANMGFAPPRQDVDAQSVCHFYGRCPWRSERCRKAPPLMTVGKRKVRCWKYAD